MKKEFGKVCSRFIIDNDRLNMISENELQEYAKRHLFSGLVDFIMKNIDTLPVEIEKRVCEFTDGTEYTVRFNLISDDEIRRLRMIEEDYSRIRFNRVAKE